LLTDRQTNNDENITSLAEVTIESSRGFSATAEILVNYYTGNK